VGLLNILESISLLFAQTYPRFRLYYWQLVSDHVNPDGSFFKVSCIILDAGILTS
jgi:hypothetical protein